MANDNFIEKIASQFVETASVKNVYGQPISIGAKTIIPVAQVAYGFGGYGRGKKTKLNKTEGKDNIPGRAEGISGGGGMFAKPKGIYEITPVSTRFIPASNTKTLLAGIALGILIKSVFLRKKRDRK